MAQSQFFNLPIDVPATTSPTLKYREADAPGNDSHLITGGDNPTGLKKGDLSTRSMGVYPPRATTNGKAPFAKLRQR